MRAPFDEGTAVGRVVPSTPLNPVSSLRSGGLDTHIRKSDLFAQIFVVGRDRRARRTDGPAVRPYLVCPGSAGLSAVGAAFTLIELLVVIAIVTVLAALLLPVLSQAKEGAKRVECLSRMKQWTQAFMLYPDDNEGDIAREGYHALGDTIINNWAHVFVGGDVWYNALPPYISVLSASNYAAPSQRLLFYEKPSLFHCPSTKFPRETASTRYPFALFSLAMNSQLISYPDNFPTIKFSKIRYPSETVTFAENRLEGEPKVDALQDNLQLGQPATMPSRFVARHKSGGNLSFADGSVSWFPGNHVVETQGLLRGSSISPSKAIRWTPD